MASIINAASSGSGGLVSTADSSGVLQLQTNGTTALSIGTNGVLTLSNALPTGSGGTGLASFTSGGVVYASSTSALSTGSALTFDGTTFTTTGSGGFYLGANNTFLSGKQSAGSGGSLRALLGIDSSDYTYNGAYSGYYWTIQGSEQMRLTTTGLGIGTSSPSYKLDVSVGTNTIAQQWQGAGTSFTLRLKSGNGATSSSSAYRLYLDYLNGTNINSYMDFYRGLAGNDGYLVFGTSGTDRMTLDSSGNLGLGVTPSAWNDGSASARALQVGAYGPTAIYSDGSANTYFGTNWYYNSGHKYFGNGYASYFTLGSGGHQWFTSSTNNASGAGTTFTGTQAMTLNNSGYLGIGTTSPSDNLTVQGSVAFNLNSTTDVFKYYTGGAGLVYAGTTTSTSIGFLTSGNERMRLDTSGNLGLGVTPSAWGGVNAFQISRGSEYADTGSIGIQHNAYYNSGWKYIASSQSVLQLQLIPGTGYLFNTAPSGTAGNAISFTQAMTLDNSGNLLVGTTTAAGKISIGGSGANRLSATGSTGTFYLGYDGANDGLQIASNTYIKFQSGSSYGEAARIDSSGNLGIGTTSPSSKLDVTRGASDGAISQFTGNGTNYNRITVSNTSGTAITAYVQADPGGGSIVKMGSLTNHPLVFATNDTERARIDTSGNLLIGTTSVTNSPSQGVQLANGSSIGGVFVGHASGTATGNYFATFSYNSGIIGSITQNGNSQVLYNISSDQRLKNDLGVVKSTNVIADTIVHDFTWKSDGSQSRGVFAQEAAKVIPDAVKVGDDGEEVTDTWQVDYSKYVPDLIVYCQQLSAQVTELQAKLKAAGVAGF